MLDSRKEEFRELISALSAATVEHLAFITSKGTATPQPMEVWLQEQKLAYRTLADRIYIAPDLDRLDIGKRYLELSAELPEKGDDFDNVADRINLLINEIVALARKG
jgi:hypothetical protein